MFVLMATEYLKRYRFPQVLFSSALVTIIMLLYSEDWNLTIFYFDNFSPSSDFKREKHASIVRSFQMLKNRGYTVG